MAQLRRPLQEFLEEETPTAVYDTYLHSACPPLSHPSGAPLCSVTRVLKTDRLVKENDGDGDGSQMTEHVVTQYTTTTIVGGEDEDEDDVDAERLLQQEPAGRQQGLLRNNTSSDNYYAAPAPAPAQQVPVPPPAQANPPAFDYTNQAFYGGGAYYADQPPVPGFAPNQTYVAPFFGDQQSTGCYPCGNDTCPTGRPAP